MSIRPFCPTGPQLGWLGQAHSNLNAKWRTPRTERLLPGRETRLVRNRDESISVVYRRTAVVTYECDGSVTLRNGGWTTPTTRSKIQEYCPTVHAWRHDWKLYIAPHKRDVDWLLDTAELVLDPERPADCDGEQEPLCFRGVEAIVLHPDGLLAYEHETRAEALARIQAWRNRPTPPPRRTRRQPNTNQLTLGLALQP